MAEETKVGKPQQFISRHGEKVALGICGLGLLAYLVLMFLGAEEVSSRTLRSEIARLHDQKGMKHAERQAPGIPGLAIAGIKPWDEVNPARPAGDWAASFPTEARGIAIKGPPPPPVRTIVIPEISLQGEKVAPGRVTLKWEVAPEVSKAVAIKNNLDPRKITSFTIERESGGAWEILAKGLPASTTTYQDAKVSPRTPYSYRIISYCDEKDYRKVATSAPVTTLGIWHVTFSNPNEGTVFVTIEKFDKTHGTVSIKHQHSTGDKIGWWKEAEEPRALHRISQEGRSIEVDFDTTMEIKSIHEKMIPVERKRCKEIISDKGYVRCEMLVDKNTIRSFEIVYVDEMKLAQKVLLPDPSTHIMAKDQWCHRHDGRKEGAGEPKEK